jgi:hypothetical protein
VGLGDAGGFNSSTYAPAVLAGRRSRAFRSSSSTRCANSRSRCAGAAGSAKQGRALFLEQQGRVCGGELRARAQAAGTGWLPLCTWQTARERRAAPRHASRPRAMRAARTDCRAWPANGH